MPQEFFTSIVYLFDILEDDVGIPAGFTPLRDKDNPQRRLRVREESTTASKAYFVEGSEAVADKPVVTETELRYKVIGASDGVIVRGNDIVFNGKAGLRVWSSPAPADLSDDIEFLPVPNSLLRSLMEVRLPRPGMPIAELIASLDIELPAWNPARALVQRYPQLAGVDLLRPGQPVVEPAVLDEDMVALHFRTTATFGSNPSHACLLESALPEIAEQMGGDDESAKLLPLFWYPFVKEAFATGIIASSNSFATFGRLGAQTDGYAIIRRNAHWVTNPLTVTFSFGRYGDRELNGTVKYDEFAATERSTGDLLDRQTVRLDQEKAITYYRFDVPFFLGAMPTEDPHSHVIAELRTTDSAGFCFFEGEISCPEDNPTCFDPIVNCQSC